MMDGFADRTGENHFSEGFSDDDQERLRVAWLPGDGVGEDVLEAARHVLEAGQCPIDFVPADVGWRMWCSEGNALPDRTIETLKETHCAVMGPILSKPRELADAEVATHLRALRPVYVSPLVRLRHELGLSVKIRPCTAVPGNPHNYRDDIDVIIVADQSEGLACGVGLHPVPTTVRRALARSCPAFTPFTTNDSSDLALSARVVTRDASATLVARAFEHATRTGRDRVTLVDKPTVLRETAGLFVETALEVARRYPSVRFEQMDVDTLCMFVLRKPEHYGVIVAESLFGGIVGDLCMQLSGGLGVAPSYLVGEDYAVFSPYHGPAPRFAGQGKVNPLATIRACAHMFSWIGWEREAKALEWAVADVVADGGTLTHDLGGTASTMDVADAVAQSFRQALGVTELKDAVADLPTFEELPDTGQEKRWTGSLDDLWNAAEGDESQS